MSDFTLALPPKLNLQNVDQVQHDLLEHAGQNICLDCADVRQVNALGVQVLRAAAHGWSQSGHTLNLTNLSEAAQEQLRLLGFSPETLLTWEDA